MIDMLNLRTKTPLCDGESSVYIYIYIYISMPIIQVIECTYVVNFFMCVNSLDSQILNQRKEYLLNAKGHFFLWLIWLRLRQSLAIWETARDFNTDIKVFAWCKLSFWISNWYPWEDIGSALCSSSGLSSPSHGSNVSDFYATVIFTSCPQFLLTPATVTSTSNDSPHTPPRSGVLIS
jgi:hypothetical protein